MATESSRIRINTAWMMGEQISRQAISLLLTIWIARSLGPSAMGNLSFALSLYALFGIVTTLGLNRILVREFSANADPIDERRLMSTSLAMRMVAGLVMGVVAVVTCLLIAPESIGLVSILVPGYLFNAFDLVDLLYQSHLRSRQIAPVRLAAFSASSLIKCGLLLHGAGLGLITLACLIDWVFIGLSFGWLYIRNEGSLLAVRPSLNVAKRLLGESGVEIIAGFSGLAFMRIDQIMLQLLRGPAEVAIMAVSSRLTEAWYFVPAAVVSSTFPIIVRLGRSSPSLAAERVRRLYREVIALTVGAALAITLVADRLVVLLYGAAYSAASTVLIVQVWCGLFMSLGIASGSWLIANRKGILNLRRNMAGAIINILLNLWLIPRYGANGAAWATLIAFATAYLLYDFIDPETRSIGMDKLRAIVWR